MKTTNLGQIIPTIGRLDRRIIIQQYTATSDAAGGEVLTWSTLVTCSAQVSYPATGSGEAYGKDQYQQIATRTTLFTVRYRETIDEKMRILCDGKYYDIERIEEIGRRRFLSLTAKLRD